MTTDFEAFSGSAAELIRYIEQRFHASLRRDLAALGEAFEAARRETGLVPDDTLEALAATFEALRLELLHHLEKEERVLFPHIVDMEEVAHGRRHAARVLAGLTQGVVSVMLREHGTAELALTSLHRISGGFAPPASRPRRAELYTRLAALDEDLRRHIALEDEVLFPKALDLERRLHAVS